MTTQSSAHRGAQRDRNSNFDNENQLKMKNSRFLQTSNAHVVFLWPELPDTIARCIGAFRASHSGKVTVIATTPRIPIKGMEKSIGQPVHWIRNDRTGFDFSIFSHAGHPDLIISGGYSTPVLASIRNQLRKKGCAVVLASDHNWTGSLKQSILDRIRHRLHFKHQFNAILVPGASGRHYHEQMGYNPEMIFEGLYGADHSIFRLTTPLVHRPREIVFVGQLIERKNVKLLARTFSKIAHNHPDWKLRIIGTGPLLNQIPKHPKIIIDGFKQPSELAVILQNARALVLPSLEEHWGIVVHEAAITGCALILANTIGAGADLATSANSITFAPRDESGLESALSTFMNWDEAATKAAEATSLKLAQKFGREAFTEAINDIIAHTYGLF